MTHKEMHRELQMIRNGYNGDIYGDAILNQESSHADEL